MTTGLKRAAVVWAVAGALLLSWAGVTSGINSGSQDAYEDDVAAAQKQQQFWRIVAGQGEGPSGVLNKLAKDLRDLPLEDISGFRGDSNRYGGISEELGFDPFNGVNCSECGPLDEQVVENVRIIRDGRVTEVLQRLEPEKPDKTSGPPGALWPLWLISLPVFVGGSYLRNKRREEHRYSEYGQEMELVRSLDEAIPELPSGQANDLATLRDQLMQNINQRIKYGEEEARAMKLEALRQEAEETLEAIAEGNRALNR